MLPAQALSPDDPEFPKKFAELAPADQLAFANNLPSAFKSADFLKTHPAFAQVLVDKIPALRSDPNFAPAGFKNKPGTLDPNNPNNQGTPNTQTDSTSKADTTSVFTFDLPITVADVNNTARAAEKTFVNETRDTIGAFDERSQLILDQTKEVIEAERRAATDPAQQAVLDAKAHNIGGFSETQRARADLARGEGFRIYSEYMHLRLNRSVVEYAEKLVNQGQRSEHCLHYDLEHNRWLKASGEPVLDQSTRGGPDHGSNVVSLDDYRRQGGGKPPYRSVAGMTPDMPPDAPTPSHSSSLSIEHGLSPVTSARPRLLAHP